MTCGNVSAYQVPWHELSFAGLSRAMHPSFVIHVRRIYALNWIDAQIHAE